MYELATGLTSTEAKTLFNLTSAQDTLFSGTIASLGGHFSIAEPQGFYLSLEYVVNNLGRSGVQLQSTLDNFYSGVKYMSKEVTVQDLMVVNSVNKDQMLAKQFFGLFQGFYLLNATETGSIFNLTSSDTNALQGTTFQTIVDRGPVLETSTVYLLMVHELNKGKDCKT